MNEYFLFVFIVFTTLSELQSAALSNPNAKWPKGEVPVYFHYSISQTDLHFILLAVEEIQQKTCVRFRMLEEDDGDVLVIKQTEHDCFVTSIGRKGGRQTMNFALSCYNRQDVLQMLMVTLGFIYEHQRPDRDDYVTINWGNIRDDSKKAFEKINASNLTLLDVYPYHYTSVMHHPKDAFSKNKLPTIIPKTSVHMLGNNQLSYSDVRKVNDYYGCSPTSDADKRVTDADERGVPTIAVVLIISFAGVCSLIIYKHKTRSVDQQKALAVLFNQLMKDTNAPHPTMEHPLGQNVSDLPYKKEFEVERERLSIGDRFGGGQFGHVWAGELKKSPIPIPGDDDDKLAVAIKGPRDGRNLDHHKALADELKIMCAIGKHPNVLALVGAVTKNMINGEFFVIVEFCGNGDLKTFMELRRSNFIDELRPPEISETNGNAPILSNRYVSEMGQQRSEDAEQDRLLPESTSLTTSDLLSFAMQVAQGMEYLSSLPCIHRDLAARNVLITSNYVCRIADFGLAKHDDKEYYRMKTSALLPYRWMSIESIVNGLFTVESDVWSYGILIYEIFTLGGLPYPDVLPASLLSLGDRLKEGYRNPKPKYCHDEIYQLAHQCWQEDPALRPTFTQCAKLMRDHLERSSSQLLEKMERSVREDAAKQYDLGKWIARDVINLPNIHGKIMPEQEVKCLCCSTRLVCCSTRTCLIVITILWICVSSFAHSARYVRSNNKYSEVKRYRRLAPTDSITGFINLSIGIIVLIAAVCKRRWLLKSAFWIVITYILLFSIIGFFILAFTSSRIYETVTTHGYYVIISYLVVFTVHGLLAWNIKKMINSMRKKEPSIPHPALSSP